MKKLASLAFAISICLSAFVAGESDARLFEDKCNPTPKCEPECFGCAPNKPHVLVELEPCAYRDKPYNYYTWEKVGEKEVASDFYDWAASPEAGY
ncbi:MAG: hypothetical protein QNJ31_00990 [Candidatus Caenarcaniphilales bacterium]|nr:hypothetical protein [Candidatus Caenarcaniphilales bacterium]